MAKERIRPLYGTVDLETTDLNPIEGGITQIGCLLTDPITLEDIDGFQCYVKPYGKKVSLKALEYTGLTLDFLEKEGLPAKEAFKQFTDFLKKNTKNKQKQYLPTLVGHNVQFDQGFLIQFFKENGADFFDFFSQRYMDTLVLSNLIFDADETMPNFKLPTCAAQLGLEEVQNHNAWDDILQSNGILLESVRRLRSSGGNSEAVEKQERFRANFKF